MHLFGIMRGIKHEQELLKTFMQAQMFKWPVVDRHTKKTKYQDVQGAYRPWEMFEYVFPEGCLPEVLKMLKISDGDQDYGGIKQSGQMALLRKVIGAEKIPKVDIEDKSIQKRFIPMRGCAIHPIGIKKDEFGITDGEDWQERL